jgi:hypothetical protein
VYRVDLPAGSEAPPGAARLALRPLERAAAAAGVGYQVLSVVVDDAQPLRRRPPARLSSPFPGS